MADYDVVVIGAGHNALISAAYAAQAGYRVGVFEKNSRVGGAVRTEEYVPGYQFDLGGSAHILIRLTPIIEELSLERFGLEYIDLDPLFFSPSISGNNLTIYKDVNKTAQSIEETFPGEGEAYYRFVQDWEPFASTVCDTFLHSPSPFELGKTFAFNDAAAIDWQQALKVIMSPYGEVLDSYFTAEEIKAPLVWMAAQSGPPPTEPVSAPFLLWHPLYHQSGVARPRGGSGMLTQALQAHIEAHGGDVFVDAPVDEILVERGVATGIRVGNEIYTGRRVLAGTHVLESLGRLLPPRYRPASLDRIRVGNGFGAILRLALDEPIEYTAHPEDEARMGLQLLCDSRQQISDAYADFLRGEPASNPPLVAMTFSAADSSLVPPGGEVLWLWAQYYPYALRNSTEWNSIAYSVSESILDAFERYAPGTRDKVVGQLFQHPAWLEKELGLLHGNVMHIEMSLDQMFTLRPTPELSQYKTHIEHLYLTGASTHPGGGIMGASGRNAARTLLASF